MHPIRPGRKRIRIVGHRRGDGVGGIRPSVVCLAYRDDIPSAGGCHREPQRQIACLRTGIHQKYGVQRFGQHRGEALAELDHRLIVEARIRVQPAQLPGRGLGDPRMGMAQHGDVVDHVEVAPARRGHQVVTPTPLDLWRFGVVVLLYRREALVATGQQIIGAMGVGHVGQAEQLARVAAERQPAPRQFGGRQGRRGWCADRSHADFGPPARRDLGQRVTGANPACPAQAAA